MENLEDSLENRIRAFVCLEVSDEVIKEVARVQELVGNQLFTGKMTELENLHLTLKFLGEIDEEKLEKVKEKLKSIKFENFEIKLCGIGVFSSKGSPRIVWIKLGGKEIFELQKRIDDSLKEYFKVEERFMSHMTIARVRYVEDKKGFLKHVKNIKVKEIKFKADNFFLKKSELKRSGPVYSAIEGYTIG